MSAFIKSALKILPALALAVGLAVPHAAAGDLTPVGSWKDNSGNTRFKVTFCGDNYELCAQLVKLSGSAKTPENMQYLNSYVLKNAKRSVGLSWKGSVDYLGEQVSGTVTLVDANTMTINGCKGMVCQKFELNRA